MSSDDARIYLQRRIVRAVREGTGLHEHLAVTVADEIIRILSADHGGDRLYIPAQDRSDRDAAIVADWQTHADRQRIARQHGVHRRTVDRIIERHLNQQGNPHARP